MISDLFSSGVPISDLVFGSSVYFPPIFKAFLLGALLWWVVHTLARDWIYSGKIWHPTLMDVSLFVLCVFSALLLIVGLL